MNSSGLQIIKDSEGFYSKPYKDPGYGIPTIGYGNTFYPDGTKVKLTDSPITKSKANEILLIIVSNFEREVKKRITSKVNENQLSALVSFAYNNGIKNFQDSTLLKKVNINPNDKTIRDEFNRWIYANKKVMNGLVIRRKKEADLYEKSIFKTAVLIPLILFFYTVFCVTV